MRLLWDKDLRMNTIHVKDLCEAIWFLMKLKEAHGEVYNAVDDGNTTQGRVTDLIASIFNISYDFCGKVMSTLTTVSICLKNTPSGSYFFFFYFRFKECRSFKVYVHSLSKQQKIFRVGDDCVIKLLIEKKKNKSDKADKGWRGDFVSDKDKTSPK